MNSTPDSSLSKFEIHPALTAFAVAACITLPAWTAKAQTQDNWAVGTADYNVAGNWTLNKVPVSGYTANNDTGSNNVVQINNGDPAWTLNAIRSGISSSGSFVQNGSTINLGFTQNGWLRMGVTAASSVGYYTINSNAVLNTPNGITVGEVGSGVLNIYGGTINVGTAATTNFVVNSGGVSGIVNQTNGTVVCSNQLWISQGLGSGSGFSGTGAYNLSGGTLNVNNFIVVGRSGGNGTLTVTGGTVNMQSAGSFFSVGSSAGTAGLSTGLVQQSGGVINCAGQFLVPAQAAGTTGTYNLSGTGLLNLTNWLAIGRNGGTGYLNLSGGAITFWAGNGGNLDIGATGTGTLTQIGGAITNTALGTWIGEQSSGNGTWTISGGTAVLGQVTIGVNASATGTLNLNGGLFNAYGIVSGNAGANSSLMFNGGVLQANANNVNFVSGLSTALVSSGGAIIDSHGYNVTMAQNLYDNGGGSMTKMGAGTLTLTGANTYSGPTAVNAGALATTTASSGGGSYTVADGATLTVLSANANGQLYSSGLSLGSSTGATLNIDLNTFGNPYFAPVGVNGTLAVNGTVKINVLAEAPLAAGQFPLISYTSETGSGSFVLGALPVGEAGYLSNNVGNLSVDLVITSAGAPSWNGTVAGGIWDVGITTNWIDVITSAATTYRDGEPVFFGDNAMGTTNVDLVAVVNPGSVTINNNTLLYTLTGPGQISGSTGLLKEGANTFAMLNTPGNGYTGATILAGGTLAVTNLANGGSPSAIGASSASPTNLALAGGTLSYSGPPAAINRGYSVQDTNGAVDIYAGSDLTLSGAVIAASGSGFTKGGPAQLIYATIGTNTLSDALGYTVGQGNVVFSGSGAGQIDNLAGAFNIGNAASTNATVILTNNTTLNLVTGGTTLVGNGGAGAVVQNGGNFNAGGGQLWIGQNVNGAGTYSLSAGKLSVNNWLAVGRDNGTGTLNLSGNAILTLSGGNYAFDIGTSGGIGGAAGNGLFTQTGGILTNNSPTWLGEGSSGEPAQGVWNMSGGSAWLFGSSVAGYPAASLYIGQSGIATNTLDISGTGSITCADYVSLGHLSGATGYLNIGSASQPGGSLAMSGPADFNVGDNGNGVLTMVAGGGGQLTVPGTLYLTRSATASGTVNLNGGVIVASHVNNGYGFGNNLTNNAQAFNFNGGTLKAYTASSVFILPYVNTVVQAGGAVIDDGGFTISINSALADGGGGGGLTKIGGGALYLGGVNTYTGTTVVSNGTWGCSGSGTIAGPVVIEAGATLAADAGTIATFSISNTLTLLPGSATHVSVSASANDQIVGLTGVSYGGTLVVTNTSGAPLTIGQTYQLFNSAVAGVGNFSSVTVLPAGNATFNPATGVLTIVSPTPVTMQAPYITGGNLILTGSGGSANSGYTLLTTTNLAAPLSAWTTNATGTLTGSGSFSNSIPVDAGTAAQFFLLRQP